MKKYRYYLKDIDVEILANSGAEAEVQMAKMGISNYPGVIELTNLETGYVNVMLPIKIL